MGATGVARAHKPDKTPIHSRAPLLPHSILQNQGKTAVLPGLPPYGAPDCRSEEKSNIDPWKKWKDLAWKQYDPNFD